MSHAELYVEPRDARAAHRQIRARERREKNGRDPRPLTVRLAEAMREIAGAGQVVDRHALTLRGFLSSELTDSNLLAARDRANRLAERSV